MPWYKRILLILGAIAMVAIGIEHFRKPDPFVRIMPAVLPAALWLVYISGAFEILGGVGLLVPKTRRAAAWGLIGLYVAVFPANVNMAVNQIQLEPGGDMPAWMMWARLPLQAFFILWAFWFTRPQSIGSSESVAQER